MHQGDIRSRPGTGHRDLLASRMSNVGRSERRRPTRFDLHSRSVSCLVGVLAVVLLFASEVLLPSPASAATKSCVPGPDARLVWCNLSGVDLAHANLSGASLRLANLKGANLTDANLTGANLTSTRLNGANLTGAILTRAILFDASSGEITGPPAALPPYWTFLHGYLIGPGADLEYTNLTGIDLANAPLGATYFNYANLSRADLVDAHLKYAYLERSNLTDADLRGAVISRSNLRGITWSNTICPDGTNSNNDENHNCGHNWRV
jgi:uncharacterized protein YjbI with pentapeptide repeats